MYIFPWNHVNLTGGDVQVTVVVIVVVASVRGMEVVSLF